MKVFCSKHLLEPMTLEQISYVGEDKIELRYSCPHDDSPKEIIIELNKKLVIKQGIENL